MVVLGERAVDALGRPRRARDRRGERLARRGRARRSARARGRRSDAARCRRRCAGRGARGSPRSCASSRSCRWCRARGSSSKRRSRRAEHGHHPPHPVQAEAHAEQLQRAQVRFGLRLAPGGAARAARSRHARAARCGVRRPGAGRRTLGVRVLAQVVDEHRAQRLAELAVAAVQRVGDQPFGGLDVVVGLALVAADASPRPGSAAAATRRTSRRGGARRDGPRGRAAPRVESSSSSSSVIAIAAASASPRDCAALSAPARRGADRRSRHAPRSATSSRAMPLEVELAGELAQLLALLTLRLLDAPARLGRARQARALLADSASSACRRSSRPRSAATGGASSTGAMRSCFAADTRRY